MRYITLISCAVIMLNSVSNATLSLDLSATDGVLLQSDPNGIPVGARVDLIWSATQSYEIPNGSMPTGPVTPGTTSVAWGSDYILNSWTTADVGFLPDDGGYTYTDSLVGDVNIESGYIYILIFQDGTVNVDDYYGRSGFTPCVDQVPLQPPPVTSLDMAPGGGGSFVVGTIANGGQGLQVVPEPSSIALLGLGLGLVALRRKMRK